MKFARSNNLLIYLFEGLSFQLYLKAVNQFSFHSIDLFVSLLDMIVCFSRQ